MTYPIVGRKVRIVFSGGARDPVITSTLLYRAADGTIRHWIHWIKRRVSHADRWAYSTWPDPVRYEREKS
ncbi:MAG: hypothetical protein AAB262_12125 [Elusimicrobiota bacterium]